MTANQLDANLLEVLRRLPPKFCQVESYYDSELAHEKIVRTYEMIERTQDSLNCLR